MEGRDGKTATGPEPGGRSGMALRRKRFASTEKSSELAHEILVFQAQSISGHSTTMGPWLQKTD